MNFDYIQEAKPETEELQNLYAALYRNLEKAEEIYWGEPQKCGMMLRKATEKICRIYNSYYGIGFSKAASLEDYLCYTDNSQHNMMVSRFLSVVRTEQRDRLEWLRVWGDECVFMDENPEEILRNPDKLYLSVKKMMVHMLGATREMCKRLNHMENLEDWVFEDHILPGYVSEEEQIAIEKQRKKESNKEKFSIFRKR